MIICLIALLSWNMKKKIDKSDESKYMLTKRQIDG